MLILPPGHAQSRRLNARERRLVGGVTAAVAALAIVLVVALSTNGRASGRGCIYATIPAATGAQQISQCGAPARDTCASARAPGAFTAQAAQVIAAECRKAGLPVGS